MDMQMAERLVARRKAAGYSQEALAAELGFTLRNLTFSPVKGPEGNIEFLGHLCMEPGDALVPDVPALVAAAHETLKG